MTEYERQELAELRMRMHMSARGAKAYGHSAKDWLESEIITKFAKKYYLEDELILFASLEWGSTEVLGPPNNENNGLLVQGIE